MSGLVGRQGRDEEDAAQLGHVQRRRPVRPAEPAAERAAEQLRIHLHVALLDPVGQLAGFLLGQLKEPRVGFEDLGVQLAGRSIGPDRLPVLLQQWQVVVEFTLGIGQKSVDAEGQVKGQGLRQKLGAPFLDLGIRVVLAVEEERLGGPSHADEFGRGPFPVAIPLAPQLTYEFDGNLGIGGGDRRRGAGGGSPGE